MGPYQGPYWYRQEVSLNVALGDIHCNQRGYQYYNCALRTVIALMIASSMIHAVMGDMLNGREMMMTNLPGDGR